ncbi:MAG: hypothetical protein C0613_04750 [Desulfobulbaceae bacterium]|nr:MAG: hypothetical protein C0613_04750 [Desulfobulbaceae bacterium]
MVIFFVMATFLIIRYQNKALTNLIKEFINFCSVLSECSVGAACLSSPWKLKDLLDQYSDKHYPLDSG